MLPLRFINPEIRTGVTVSVDTPKKIIADLVAVKDGSSDMINIKHGINSEIGRLRLRII